MELAADRPDPLGQGGLEVHVDVLEAGIPGEGAGFDVPGEALEAVDERTDLGVGQKTRPTETVDVGDRAAQVVEGEDGVGLDRPGEVGHPFVTVLAEASAPESHRPSGPCPSYSHGSGAARLRNPATF